MMLGLAFGITIGIAISALWNLFLRLVVAKTNAPSIQHIPEPPVVRFGPFLKKKESGKRKPKSHTDDEIVALEMQDRTI